MKLKYIPPFLMLLAGAVSSIVMFTMHYELKTTLSVLLVVLIVFYIAGVLLKVMFMKFTPDTEQMKEEGAVIEKEGEAESIAVEEQEEESGESAEGEDTSS